MTSYRREILDSLLERHVPALHGTVLDIGGKRQSPRGRFRAGSDAATKWLYVNIDTSTRPHAIADAHQLPLVPASVDAVLCCEVLEHVRDARICCREILSVLKPGGRFVFSVPFLFPIHADPHDFLRFTHEGVRQLARDFAIVQIEPMGSWLGTLGMFLELGGRSTVRTGIGGMILRRVTRVLGRFLCRLDARNVLPSRSFTTGYFCIATKGMAG